MDSEKFRLLLMKKVDPPKKLDLVQLVKEIVTFEKSLYAFDNNTRILERVRDAERESYKSIINTRLSLLYQELDKRENLYSR